MIKSFSFGAVVVVLLSAAGCGQTAGPSSGTPLLRVDLRTDSPGAGFVSAGDADVLVLALNTVLDGSSAITLDTLAVRVSGARGALSTLRFKDANDDQVGATAVVDERGIANFAGLDLPYAADQARSLLVFADIATDALQPASFLVSFASAAGRVEGSDVNVGFGGSAFGSPQQVRASATLRLSAAATNPLPRLALIGDEMTALAFGAVAADVAVRVTRIDVHLVGDAAFDQNLAGAALFLDENQNGALDAAFDDVLAVVPAPAFGAPDLVFGDLDLVVPPTTTAHFAVLLQLAPAAQAGAQVQLALQGDNVVTAVDAVTGRAAAVSGGPVAGGALTLDDGAAGLRVTAGDTSPSTTSFASLAAAVSVLQVRVSASALEAVALSEVSVVNSGSGSAADVVSARLFIDADSDGTLSQGDAQLGSAGAFLDGQVRFSLRTEGDDADLVIAAGASVDVIAVYDFAALGSGRTFAASVAAAGVRGVGQRSQRSLTSIGAAGGALFTSVGIGTLTISRGAQSPGLANESADAAGVLMTQVALRAGANEDVVVDAVTIAVAGTLHDPTGITRAQLFIDANEDGDLNDVDDAAIGGDHLFDVDNGTVTFNGLALAVPAGQRRSLMVVYDLSGTGFAGQSFSASVPTADAVVAHGAASAEAILCDGIAAGALKTIQFFGSLVIAAGASSPGTSNESDAGVVEMLQFALSAGSVENVALERVVVRTTGTADDLNDITAVRLLRDIDDDGRAGVDDVDLGRARFDANNGSAEFIFDDDAVVLLASTRTTYVVVYELAGSALPGQSFSASVANTGAVTGHGVLSARPVFAVGAAFGALKTVQGIGTLVLSVGSNTPGASAEAATATGVAVLQLRLSASTVEDIAISQIVVRAAGSANDFSLVGGIALFEDDDGDGTLLPGAVALARAAGFNSDNGTATLADFDVRVARGSFRTLLVTWDLVGGALSGQTFQAVVVGAGVGAVGAASGAVVVPTGSASGGVNQIQGAGTLTAVLGANTPGSSIVAAEARDLEIFQFTILTSGVESVRVHEVDIRALGSADDAEAVSSIELFLDVDRNGHVGAVDRLLGTLAGYDEDNGVVAFRNLDAVLPSSSQTSFLVRYQLSGTGLPAQTVGASLTALSFIGIGVSSNVEIVAVGAASGATKTIQGAGIVTVALGANSPGSSVVAVDAAAVDVLQLTATTNATEAVRVTAIGVRAGGTLDDTLSITAVELFVDVNKDGRVTSIDRGLGGSVVFDEDNGVASFVGLNEILAASSQTAFVVRYRLSGAALPVQTLNASVLALAFLGVGVQSNVEVVAAGSATGAFKSIQNRGALTLLAGVRTPGASVTSASAVDVVLLQFQLTASTVEDVVVDSVVVRAGGTADDRADIAAVRLLRDSNGDGVDSAGDVVLSAATAYVSDNGTATFNDIGDIIVANTSVAYLLLYDLSGTASGNDSLTAALTNGIAVGAHGVVSGIAVATVGSAQGALLSVRTNPLVLKAGAHNPGSQSVHPGDGSVVALQLTLAVAAGEDVFVDGITVTAAGSGVDSTGIAAVSLVRDEDGGGAIDAGDVAVGGSVLFSADNAIAGFADLGERITGPAEVSYIVVYDFSGAALPNQTFQARIAAATAVEAVDARSLVSVLSGGVAVNGGVLTVVGDTNFWTTLPSAGAPQGRSDHTAVAIGSRMLIFGGVDAVGPRADGAIFDATTNTWSTLPSTDAPSPRSNHAAAALGPRMVIFGGFSSAQSALDDGAVFDTNTNTWTPTSSTSSPSRRALVASAVTTDRVFFFGGVDTNGAALNSGALYDPVTNSWEALPTAGAPSARYNAVARFLPNVGVAGRVLVVGGFNGGATFFADGALFDVATQTWSSIAAAPTPFAAAAAAVLGSRVIIEGGQNPSGPAATALLYDVGSNSWRNLPTVGAPSPRVGHSGVAINGRAVFYGGFSGSAFVATGARYSPVTDLWSPTATAGAPTARAGHSVVVIGGKLLVWGGLAENTFLNNGSSYTP